MHRYLALLRGINVGGNNIIRMADLKSAFENMEFGNVRTYIQSGNVLFSSKEANIAKLSTKIEQALTKQFNYKAKIVLVNHNQLQQIVEHAPKSFGTAPNVYRYDVAFLKEPLTANEALKQLKLKQGVDTAEAKNKVLYFSRLIEKASQSQLIKLSAMSIYQNMTLRNWNTTTKLLTLMNE